ncbi:sensor histidine kinase [Caldalkalibacillus mannanilyticus]|uniref:sensor histidine kinase n=1 Tax=Caldalkalibacillus mannanilyticus TaxID=1418 RepID=UPI00046929F5|nr:HAMP domain-containing sensor histidine kinase [Caldalkalibacillus mannanilyticus]
MGMRNTISVYFIKWILKVSFAGIVILLLNIVIITWGLHNNIFLPANEPIKRAEKVKNTIEDSDYINTEILPPQLDYIIFDKKTKQIVSSNLNQRDIERAKKVYLDTNNGKSSSYLRYDSKYETILIQYTLRIQFARQELRKVIPSPGVILSIFFLGIYCFYLVYNIRDFSKIIIKENQKLIYVTRKIKERDLNIQFPAVHFNEYKDVMGAMKSLSEALMKSIQNEIESNRSKAEQISYLVHDIKIPLTVIKGNVELLQMSMNKNEKESYSDIMNAIQQIELYIQEVIDINLNQREITLNREEVSVIDVIGKIEDKLRNFGNHHIIIENKVDEEATIFIDLKLFIRGIINILMNGIERTPPEEKVRLLVRQDKELIHFIIIDRGPGFTKEALERGTELFFTENHGRTHNSHYGLGLTFTERVIKQHNGKIKLSNNVYNSGEVLVEIPIR